jgi:hypothetical protein
VLVKIAPAGDRALAADVEGGQRVQLPGIRDAGDHPELLRHSRIGGCCLHAPEFEGRPRVFVEIGQDGGRLDGVRREAERCLRAHGARRVGDRGAVLGDEQAGDPIIGAGAVEIVLHDRDAGGLPRRDRRVQILDRRLFQTKRLLVCTELRGHSVTPLCVGSRCGDDTAAGFHRATPCAGA